MSDPETRPAGPEGEPSGWTPDQLWAWACWLFEEGRLGSGEVPRWVAAHAVDLVDAETSLRSWSHDLQSSLGTGEGCESWATLCKARSAVQYLLDAAEPHDALVDLASALEVERWDALFQAVARFHPAVTAPPRVAASHWWWSAAGERRRDDS